MTTPEAFKPKFVDEQRIPIEGNYILYSEDRIGGELWDATYRINEKFPTREGIVVFDTIEFTNDQYCLEKDIDYIQRGTETPVYIDRNLTFSQKAEVAAYFCGTQGQDGWLITRLNINANFDETNPYTIRISMAEPTDGISNDITISYKLSRLLGFYRKDRIINENGDVKFNLTGGKTSNTPVKPFINKYRWTINFGENTRSITSNQQHVVMAEGNFSRPSTLMMINGQQLKDSFKYTWKIQLLDDRGYPHKIFSEYEIKFRVITIEPARWFYPDIPKRYRNLLSKKPKPQVVNRNFRQEVKTTHPTLSSKLEIIHQAGRLEKRIEKLREAKEKIHPTHAKYIDTINQKIINAEDMKRHLLEQSHKAVPIAKDGTSSMSLTIANRVDDIADTVKLIDSQSKTLGTKVEDLVEATKDLTIDATLDKLKDDAYEGLDAYFTPKSVLETQNTVDHLQPFREKVTTHRPILTPRALILLSKQGSGKHTEYKFPDLYLIDGVTIGTEGDIGRTESFKKLDRPPDRLTRRSNDEKQRIADFNKLFNDITENINEEEKLEKRRKIIDGWFAHTLKQTEEADSEDNIWKGLLKSGIDKVMEETIANSIGKLSIDGMSLDPEDLLVDDIEPSQEGYPLADDEEKSKGSEEEKSKGSEEVSEKEKPGDSNEGSNPGEIRMGNVTL